MDTVKPEARSRMMSSIRGKNTKPELTVRSFLHRSGFRFRLHRKDLPGRPDLVLPKWKVALFVNGCFWHGHEQCRYFRVPTTRRDFWLTKIKGNAERDARTHVALLSSGWRVIVVWECALKGDAERALHELIQHIQGNSAMAEVRGEATQPSPNAL